MLFVHRGMICLACLVLPCEGMGRMINLVLSHLVLPLSGSNLRACLAKMGPFRWATVSAVKMTSPF